MRKALTLISLVGALCGASAADTTLSFFAVEDAEDGASSDLGSNLMVLWLVDRSGGTFDDLVNDSGLTVTPNTDVTVGSVLNGDYEIVANEASYGTGLIDSGITITSEDSPPIASSAISAGDQFAVIWFPSLAFGTTALSAANDGISFGFATGTGLGTGDWVLPASTSTLFYSPTPAANSNEIQQVTGGAPNYTLNVQSAVVPEPSAFSLLFALGAFAVFRRR